MSEISGTKLAEVPTPISRPDAAANCHRVAAWEASAYPAASATAPTSKGTSTPRRSASRPISTPPSPKPIMVRVNGREAPPRATSNSACTDGRATTTDHMPTPPIVARTMETARRSQA